MKFEYGKRVQIRKEIPLSELRFRIPRRRLVRQCLLSAVLMAIPIGALFLDIDRELQWFALGFTTLFIAMSFLFSGVFSDEELEEVDPASHYGRGTLIGIGIFWLLLIAGVAWAMYVQFPRS